MRALRVHQFGQAPVLEHVPEPSLTRPDDVVVRIGGSGLCRMDLHVIEGRWRNGGTALPLVPGHENAGWVTAVGPAVRHIEPGDPVILHPLVTCGTCRACRAGQDPRCPTAVFPGVNCDGGFAQYVKTNGRAALRLPPGVQPADVAALADAGLTTYHAVQRVARLLHPGSTVVVLGTGGLGHLGVQLLKALTPAEIFAVDSSDQALKLAEQCGADYPILADGRQVQRILDMTEGQGAEAVLDFVGEGGAVEDSLALVRRAGTYVVIGEGGELRLPTLDAVARELTVIGSFLGTYNELAELLQLTARGRIAVQTRTYPLEAAGDALNDLQHGRLQGRGVLVPDSDR